VGSQSRDPEKRKLVQFQFFCVQRRQTSTAHKVTSWWNYKIFKLNSFKHYYLFHRKVFYFNEIKNKLTSISLKTRSRPLSEGFTGSILLLAAYKDIIKHGGCILSFTALSVAMETTTGTPSSGVSDLTRTIKQMLTANRTSCVSLATKTTSWINSP